METAVKVEDYGLEKAPFNTLRDDYLGDILTHRARVCSLCSSL